jgi:hypothetical protein
MLGAMARSGQERAAKRQTHPVGNHFLLLNIRDATRAADSDYHCDNHVW